MDDKIKVSIEVSAYAYQTIGATISKEDWEEYKQTGDKYIIVRAVCSADDFTETEWEYNDLTPEEIKEDE